MQQQVDFELIKKSLDDLEKAMLEKVKIRNPEYYDQLMKKFQVEDQSMD